MLPGLGFSEILVLGVIALLVVGPKDLPLMLRKLGRWMAKLRGMAQEFRTGFDELARQAELDELKREVEALRRHSSFSGLVNEITRPVDLSPISEPTRAALPRPDRTTARDVEGAPEAPAVEAPIAAPEPELPFEPAAKTGEAR